MLFTLALLLPGVSASANASRAPVIVTDDGPIQGRQGVGITLYHGVPFAAPPVGKFRFASPQRPLPWSKTLRTMFPKSQCPQLDLIKGIHFGEEDCLYLSVYVPVQCTPSTPCAVMQWIYGGAWIIGSNEEYGLYDASTLAKTHGVIVVAANYRLDALGWLAVEELADDASLHGSSGSSVYGNYGLRDQRLAMQWTQRNIAKFGGLPSEVTLFGESAGGFSVCQHLASPASDRLFSRAIMQSAGCDGPFLITDGVDAKRFGSDYATAAGCPPTSTPAARAACLRALPLRDVILPYLSWLCPLQRFKQKDPWCNVTATGSASGATDDLGGWPEWRPPLAPIAGFTAVVDGSSQGLPDTPLALFAKGRINRAVDGAPLKLILGTNTDEFALFVAAAPLSVPNLTLPVTAAGFRATVDHLVSYHDGWNATTTAQIDAAYAKGDRFPTEASRLVAFGTDLAFRCETRAAARALAAHGVETYLYNFDFHGMLYRDPASKLCALTAEVGCGVHHAAELRYVFDTFGAGALPASHSMARTIGTYWTNFAKGATPNGPGVATWPVYDATRDENIHLGAQVEVRRGFGTVGCDFFDSLPRQTRYPHAMQRREARLRR